MLSGFRLSVFTGTSLAGMTGRGGSITAGQVNGKAILIDNPDLAPQEGGEPAITCMGALVANAVFDATGKRFHELPINKERLRKALKAS